MNLAAKTLLGGGVIVTKTDTLYGILGRVDSKEAVDRIYQVKKRDLKNPLLVLISKQEQLDDLGINISSEISKIISEYWPGPTTIVFDLIDTEATEHIHRGKNTLAVRLPDDAYIRELIDLTGPLVAPSANPEGMKPASNIEEAKAYFKAEVDHYKDRGECLNVKASQIIKLKEGEIVILRS